jgi:spore photoproduct lyase family protein
MSLDRLIDIRRIYMEPAVADLQRGQEILSRYPEAERIEIESHQRIPELFGNEGGVRHWVRNKREVLILGVKKSVSARENGRSVDWIAPSLSNGCAMSCTYCYVPRRKGFANPITTFVNVEQILGYLERHAIRQGMKMEPNQVDPSLWVYDIGENGDCSVDAAISDNVRDVVALFRGLPNAKASFATKYVNRDLLSYDPQGRTRVRFSLMPAAVSQKVDLRTSRIADRFAAIDDFVEAGDVVHVNFSPVIVYDNWPADWEDLFRELDDVLGERAKAQLACEVIFLTHNEGLHEVNLGWNPRGEEILWRPDLQEPKRSQNGQSNVRYKARQKQKYLAQFLELVERRLPYCRVRYAF